MDDLADIERLQQIAALGERLPATVLDADETIRMYVPCAERRLTGDPATSTTA